MSDRNPDVDRDKLPHEVYAKHTNYVTLGMKTLTAQRMIGWLRDYARYCELADAPKTAEHAWAVSNQLAGEVETESMKKPPESGGEK